MWFSDLYNIIVDKCTSDIHVRISVIDKLFIMRLPVH